MKRSIAATVGSTAAGKWAALRALLPGLLLAASVSAEPRQLGTHQHGLAELNIVIEQGNLAIELVTPSANLLGFEHPPRSAEEREALQRALQSLKPGAALFGPNAAASCQQTEVVVDSPLLAHQGQDEHEHEKRHDQHHHDDQPADASTAPPMHEPETGHSEFHAAYRFRCERADNLTNVKIGLWQRFPGFQQLRVQLLTDNSQRLLYLSRADLELQL